MRLSSDIFWLQGLGFPPLDDPRMGLAAGGRIEQKIYKDTRPVCLYDEAAGERLCIHALSTGAWEASKDHLGTLVMILTSFVENHRSYCSYYPD